MNKRHLILSLSHFTAFALASCLLMYYFYFLIWTGFSFPFARYSACGKTTGCHKLRKASCWWSHVLHLRISNNNLSLLDLNFFPNGPKRIRIFQLMHLHEAFFTWLGFYFDNCCHVNIATDGADSLLPPAEGWVCPPVTLYSWPAQPSRSRMTPHITPLLRLGTLPRRFWRL